MSDFNIQNLWTESQLKVISKKFEHGISEKDWEELNKNMLDFTELIRNNFIITRDSGMKIFYRNESFLKMMKKILLSEPEKFQRVKELNEKTLKLNYQISNISHERYDSEITRVYKHFCINKASEINKKKDYFSFSGVYLLTLIQEQAIFPDYISSLSIDEIHNKVKNNEFTWVSNLAKEHNFDDDSKDYDNIDKFIKHFYELAEIENICPFKLKNNILNVMLYNRENLFRNKDYFFNIIYDDYLLNSLPSIKEKDKELYDDLLNNLVYLLSIKTNSQGRYYLHNLRGLYSQEYRKESGDVERFEKLLNKLPLKDILKIKVNVFNIAEGLVDWMPELKVYVRENELREILSNKQLEKDKDEGSRKKI